MVYEGYDQSPTTPVCCCKVLAEREAWQLAKASGLDLVAVLPNFVLGPVLSARVDGLSAGFVKVHCT